jgi:hypothetical protein
MSLFINMVNILEDAKIEFNQKSYLYRIQPLRETLQRDTYFPKHYIFQMDIVNIHAKKKFHLLYLILIIISIRYLFIYH